MKEYWIIDPERKRAEFFLPGKRKKFQAAALDAKGRFESRVLPGLWLDPVWFWTRPFPKPLELAKKWKLIYRPRRLNKPVGLGGILAGAVLG